MLLITLPAIPPTFERGGRCPGSGEGSRGRSDCPWSMLTTASSGDCNKAEPLPPAISSQSSQNRCATTSYRIWGRPKHAYQCAQMIRLHRPYAASINAYKRPRRLYTALTDNLPNVIPLTTFSRTCLISTLFTATPRPHYLINECLTPRTTISASTTNITPRPPRPPPTSPLTGPTSALKPPHSNSPEV